MYIATGFALAHGAAAIIICYALALVHYAVSVLEEIFKLFSARRTGNFLRMSNTQQLAPSRYVISDWQVWLGPGNRRSLRILISKVHLTFYEGANDKMTIYVYSSRLLNIVIWELGDYNYKTI